MKKKVFLIILSLAIILFGCEETGNGGSEGNGNNDTDFDIAGTYTSIQSTASGSLTFTFVFKTDKTYEVTRSIGSTKDTGTWSVTGMEITLTSTSSVIPIPAETFTITEGTNQVTLTLKGSAQVSNLFLTFGFTSASLSVTLTKQSGGGEHGGEPVKTPFLVKQVSAGFVHTVAIKTDGTLWAWGRNEYGQLGDGTGGGGYGDHYVNKNPTQIGNDSNWASVSSSYCHTVAIKTDGTLWAWGANWHGQLGDGTDGGYAADESGNKNIPTKIGTDNNWATVSAGEYHTVAIKKDGTLWAWGYNRWGQLGDGTSGYNSDKNIPTKIGTDNNWASVSVGGYNTVAIKTDGTLWAWGANEFGQLGDGSGGGGDGDHSGDKNIPTKIGTDNNWASVLTGSYTVAIKTNGSLWAWGKLEDTTTNVNPTQIGTDTNWAFVSNGYSHSVAIKTDGSLWVWGGNYEGQLGLVDNDYREEPTQVFCSE